MAANADQLQLRRATPADATYLSLLARVTFEQTFGHLFRDPQDLRDYYDRTYAVAKFRDSISKSNNLFWLALADELPVGYAKLKLHSPCPYAELEPLVQLQKIYVLRDFLGFRVGPLLLDTTLQAARAAKAAGMWLSVENNNHRAIRFYEKHGFVKVGDHPFSIGKEDFGFTAMLKDFQ